MARDAFVGVGTCPRHPLHLGRKLIERARAVGMAMALTVSDFEGGQKTVVRGGGRHEDRAGRAQKPNQNSRYIGRKRGRVLESKN